MRKIGYLRVSTDEQLLDRQINGLRPLCDEIYVETLSAVSKRRPFYTRAIRRLRAGDTLVVWDTDRAYRSAREALNEIDALRKRGIQLLVVNFPIDTTTAEGYFFLTVILGACEYERNILSRRTKEGLAAARLRGQTLGRPRKLSSAQIEEALQRLQVGEISMARLAKAYGVGRWTLSRALKRAVALRHGENMLLTAGE